MRLALLLIKPVLCCVIITLLWTGFAFSAEQDDSSLFVEAFNAFQKKDFILVLEKIDQLNRAFPDTPLRDVSLLLQARAAYNSGDNELAAKSVNMFRAEFSNSTLQNTVEDELLKLCNRLNAGDKLLPDKKLRTAAQKVRAAQLEQERTAALKAEQERIAREQAERDRLARAKAETERREQERIAAELAAKAGIKLEIIIPENNTACEAGTTCRLPVQLVNKGTDSEEFVLSVPATMEYAAALTSTDTRRTRIERLTLAPGTPFKCDLSFSMPGDKVDGFRPLIPIKVVSGRFSDVSFAAKPQLTASAPLVRVVARPASPRAARGKNIAYRIMVLNAGSLATRNLRIKVISPDQAELTSMASFDIDILEPGNLKEFIVSVKISERARDKQELRCRVEVDGGTFGQKISFASAPVTVQTSAN